ncbi:MAG TPA: DUF3147 family protein [Steroidobacteraceae bacterium]
MRIEIHLSQLRHTRWYEYALRFVLGGAVCALAGFLADRFGPGVGGLFLAFPAIFPASATLVEKHEAQKKHRAGIEHTVRGREAAGLDAAGATLGGLALCVFAALIYRFLPVYPAIATIGLAALAWLATATSLWWMRKKHFLGARSRRGRRA